MHAGCDIRRIQPENPKFNRPALRSDRSLSEKAGMRLHGRDTAEIIPFAVVVGVRSKKLVGTSSAFGAAGKDAATPSPVSYLPTVKWKQLKGVPIRSDKQ